MGLAALATATPVAPRTPVNHNIRGIHSRQSNATEPCAQVSDFLAANDFGPVPARIALACLHSIPLNVASAKRLIAALPMYVQWQSTLSVLADPPAEYTEKVQPPIDIMAGLKKIAADVDAGLFMSEYDFGWTLYTLFLSAHDGHFSYIPDTVGGLFTFSRPVPLVSVSEDGVKLPSIFAFKDILGSQFNNISYTPSRVVEIDGRPAEAFLEELSLFGSLQDRDALYNNLFYELAQVSLGSYGNAVGAFAGGGRGRFNYPGATTTLKFENGSSLVMENLATSGYSFSGIRSGQDIADHYLTLTEFSQNFAKGADVIPPARDPQAQATPPGYPTPIQAGPLNLINGFFVDAAGYEDVAVLQVPNFVGEASAQIGFQRTSKEFIAKAVAAGKTKLILDVQANGGGTILQGYDLFKQLFPDIDPVGRDRFRATESLDLIGQAWSAQASKSPREPTLNNSIRQYQSSYFDYHYDQTADGKPFGSWAEKLGPHKIDRDLYTSVSRWNLSDVHITYSSGGINIHGYGPLANVSKQRPFKAENIVILTDGYCASTCTIFSEFLTKQAGVKTIAMGGRSNSNPIQAIGGVKGTNNFGYSYIQALAQTSVYIAEDQATYNSSVLQQYNDEIVFNRAAAGPGINVRDGLKYKDDSGIALQFIYEEADCRLYYTPEMTVDITAVWKAAADVQWGSKGQCVKKYASGKRGLRGVTKKLGRRHLKISQAAAKQQQTRFDKSMELKTHCDMKGDGFMHP